MDHISEPPPSSPSPSASVVDDAHLETLLRQTIAEQVVDVAIAPDALPRLNARLDVPSLPCRFGNRDLLLAAVETPPRLRALGEDGVEHLDVLHAPVFQPGAQGIRAAFAVDGDTILPRRAAAENARERSACFSGKFERLAENFVRDARA